MKTLSNFAFLVYLFTSSVLNAQSDIRIKLAYKEGHKPFPRIYASTEIVKDTSPFKIKNNIKDYVIREIPFCPEHYKYHDFKNKLISAEDFNRATNAYKIDTAKVYQGTLKSKAYCLVGQTEDGKRSVIFDQNGDFDFNNDYEYLFEYPNTKLPPIKPDLYKNTDVFALTDTLKSVRISAECIYDDKKYTREVLIRPIPYNSGTNELIDKANRFPLQYTFTEHLEGTFEANAHTYHIALYNKGYPMLSFRNAHNRLIMLRRDDEAFPSLVKGLLSEGLYWSKDTLYIEDNKYTISAISDYAEEMTLKYQGKSPKQSGSKKGQYIPDFEAKDLAANTINIQHYRNKYVLLNFWGTWSKSSIAILPKMKTLYSRIDPAKIEFIGVGFEKWGKTEQFKEFIKDIDIRWPQILQILEETDTNLAKKFNIAFYPTFFLVDQEGKIIFKGNSEDEFDAFAKYISKKFAY